MSLQDTAQHVMLEGQYGFYNEKSEYAFATDSARFLEFSQGDTLFLHGDTLKMTTVDSPLPGSKSLLRRPFLSDGYARCLRFDAV